MPPASTPLSHAWLSLGIFWGVTSALTAAVGMQLWLHELPCALCWLQRFAMMLVMVAQLTLLGAARHGRLSITHVATNHGLTILAAALGFAISTRQVFLHILPGDPGYGMPLFGLHLYTWGAIMFASCILASAFALACHTRLQLGQGAPAALLRVSIWAGIALIAINGALVFAMQGMQWELDGDPTHYRLLRFGSP